MIEASPAACPGGLLTLGKNHDLTRRRPQALLHPPHPHFPVVATCPPAVCPAASCATTGQACATARCTPLLHHRSRLSRLSGRSGGRRGLPLHLGGARGAEAGGAPGTGTAEQRSPPALLDVACGQGPASGSSLLLAHQYHPHAIAIAVIAALTNTGDVGPPARGERPGTVGHGEREAVHDVIIVSVSQCLRHGVLDEDARSPQASAATVEGTLRKQGGKQRPQVFAYLADDTALALPRHAAAPLSRQTQAEHLAVAHEGR